MKVAVAEKRRIGDFCTTGTGSTPSRAQNGHFFGGTIPWVKSGELDENVITSTEECVTAEGMSAARLKLVPAGTILVALYGATVGKTAKLGINATTNQAVCHIVPDPELADAQYVWHALRAKLPEFLAKRTGGAQQNISQGLIRETEMQLPPLAEQKRIARILDKADAVRRNRRAAVMRAAQLRRAAFGEFFGDPASNPRRWPTVTFRDILAADGLRNGVSPSRDGMVSGKVLILSAITGETFDGTAVKEARFQDPPSEAQLVADDEFLICRGNGNIGLVGAGHFPTRSMRDTVFPDTMIAARLNHLIADRAFIEAIWATTHVRRQIEGSARTTNGTHKVNQQALARISLPLPPFEIQRAFARFSVTTEALVRRLIRGNANDLFHSLIKKAFAGRT